MTFNDLVTMIKDYRGLTDRTLASMIMDNFILAKIDDEIKRLEMRPGPHNNDCVGSSITRLNKLKSRMQNMKVGEIGRVRGL